MYWISKNPASGLREGNNCWTTSGTLLWFGAQQYIENDAESPAKIHQEGPWKEVEHLWGRAEDLLE